MKSIINIFLLLLISATINAQTSKTVIVEHFTNTKCSVCASKNPAFFSVIDNNPDVIHIAYHPSSPYSTCVFSQHNKSENDDRTKYYNIYGGTPRVVMQGKVVASSNPLLAQPKIDNESNQNSNYEIRITQKAIDNTNVTVEIIIKKIATDSDPELKLYSLIAEKEINYNAPNGEKVHHNVFRKVLVQQDVSLSNINDSVIITHTYAIDPVWQADQLFIAAMLQISTKEIIQSSKSVLLDISTSLSDKKLLTVIPDNAFYPNPVNSQINFYPDVIESFKSVRIYNLLGELLLEENLRQQLELNDFTPGQYILQLYSRNNELVNYMMIIH